MTLSGQQAFPGGRRFRPGPGLVALPPLLLLASAMSVSAQAAGEVGRVSGRIVDEDTARPLSLAQISIAALNTGTLSDVDGRWTMESLPPGTYDVVARLIGYTGKTITGVTVTAGNVTTIDISLPPQAIEMSELSVTVADQRGTASAVLENRQTAAALTDAIVREQISDSPDSDAAAAMARVPGVSIVDKKFVFVRGLGERYGNTTLDGAVMPSPIADRKAVPLDLVPASFIENVSTSKSYLPRQPADYAGGLVQIETRKVPGENFFKVGFGTGMETATTGRTGLAYAGSGLDFLGIDDGLRGLPDLLPTDVPVNRRNLSRAELEAIGEAFAAGWAGTPLDLPFGRSGEFAFATEVPLGSKDLGLLATAHWDDSWNRREGYVERVFASSGLADPEVDYGGDQSTRAVTLGGLLNVDYPLAPSHRISFNGLLNRVTEDQARVLQGFNLDSNTDQRNTRIQYVENSLVQGRLSGKHYFNAFGGTTAGWKGAYSRAGRYEPNTREVLYRESSGVFLWDNFIQSGSIFHQDLTEDAINLNLDAQFPIRVNGQAGTIEVGASSLSRDRDVLSRRFRFLPNRSIPDEVKAASPDAIFTPENIGPGPRQFEIQEATFRPDNYVADQTTTGAYAMADVELLPRLRFAGGARIERSKQAVAPLDVFTRGATTNPELPRPDPSRRHARSVVHGPQIPLADRRRGEHGDRGQVALPVRARESSRHDLHLLPLESRLDQLRWTASRDQVVQDEVRLGVGDPQILFIRLSPDEVGRGRLVHDLGGYPHRPRERPHLALEQVPERIHRRRIVRMPRVVAEEPLRLVPGADRRAESLKAWSKRTIIRWRAATFPRRWLPASGSKSSRYPSTAFVISTVCVGIPNFRATRSASSRLRGLEVR